MGRTPEAADSSESAEQNPGVVELIRKEIAAVQTELIARANSRPLDRKKAVITIQQVMTMLQKTAETRFRAFGRAEINMNNEDQLAVLRKAMATNYSEYFQKYQLTKYGLVWIDDATPFPDGKPSNWHLIETLLVSAPNVI
jgi:hypothetical protein